MPANGAIQTNGIFHIAIVPQDLDWTVERYWEDLGVGPWQLTTLGHGSERVRLYGKSASLAVRAAITQVGPLMIALDYPLSRPNPYEGVLQRKGGGAHHLAFLVDRLETAAAKMRDFGYEEITCMSGIGETGNGAGAYFETVENLGTVIELAQLPKQMPTIEAVFPPVPGMSKRKFNILGVDHVGIAVRDAEKTAQHYQAEFGIGPWEIRTLRPELGDGERQPRNLAAVKQALTRIGPIALALEQPLAAKSALQDFLDQHGQGIHHVCLSVERFAEAAEAMRHMGYEALEAAYASGAKAGAAAAYFNTSSSLGVFLELTESRA